MASADCDSERDIESSQIQTENVMLMDAHKELGSQSTANTTDVEDDAQPETEAYHTEKTPSRSDSTDSTHPADCHDSAAMHSVQGGNWKHVAIHFRNDLETLRCVSPPAPQEEILQNFQALTAHQVYHLVTRMNKQLDELWESASSDDNSGHGVFHLHPCTISPAVRQWLVNEAGKKADDVETLFIARFCTDIERDVLLTEVVDRGNWRLASQLIARGMASKLKHQWVLEEAAKNGDEWSLSFFILPCCTSYTNNDSVMKTLVSRKLFDVCRKLLLKNTCSEATHVWALTVASKIAKADDPDLRSLFSQKEIMSGFKLDDALTEVTRRGLWRLVNMFLQKDCVSRSDTRMKAVMEACTRAGASDLLDIITNCTIEELDAVLLETTKRRMWPVVRGVFSSGAVFVGGNFQERALDSLYPKLYKEDSLWLWQRLRRFDHTVILSLLIEAIRQSLSDLLGYLFTREWYYASKFGISSTLAQPDSARHRSAHQLAQSNPVFPSLFSKMSSVYDGIFAVVRTDFTNKASGEWQEFLVSVQSWSDTALACHADIPAEAVAEWEMLLLQSLMERLAKTIANLEVYENLQSVLAMVPVSPVLQNVCLKFLASPLREAWDLVGHVCWFHVQEEVRRYVFRQAVQWKKWETVARLASHTILYDDDRQKALTQATKHEQWGVVLSLADHGLTKDQLRRVHIQVATHGQWETVQQLLQLGADVDVIIADMESASVLEDRPGNPPQGDGAHRNKARLDQLVAFRHTLEEDCADFESAVDLHNWPAILLEVRRQAATAEQTERATEAAIQAKAWSVVAQLVVMDRGMTGAQRDALLVRMVEEQGWEACRVLLLQPGPATLDVVCRGALASLLKAHQWILVAQATERDTSDSTLEHVMREALHKGEGSLVAHCISRLQRPLTLGERGAMFDQALTRGLWGAVKRLAAEQDDLGHTQRDVAFALASEYRQWDVIFHCLQHGAQADRRDEEGYTLLNTCGKKDDWELAEELVRWGADPNLPDPKGYTALHRAFSIGSGTYRNFDAGYVKTLIEFHADITKPDPKGHTPLLGLIQAELADLLEAAVTCGQNVTGRVHDKGNTVLHVLCRKGPRAETVRRVVEGGGDPLAVSTADGKTILCAATERSHLAGEMVAACIKLGVSTFQPKVTDKYRKRRKAVTGRSPFGVQELEAASPFQRAAVLGDLALMDVLYQAGACSYAELRRFYSALKAEKRKLPPHSRPGKKARELLSYVQRLARTPRSLKSSCRLAVSHHLGAQWEREERVLRLTQLSDTLREYVLFSDLTMPAAEP